MLLAACPDPTTEPPPIQKVEHVWDRVSGPQGWLVIGGAVTLTVAALLEPQAGLGRRDSDGERAASPELGVEGQRSAMGLG